MGDLRKENLDVRTCRSMFGNRTIFLILKWPFELLQKQNIPFNVNFSCFLKFLKEKWLIQNSVLMSQLCGCCVVRALIVEEEG